MSKSKKDLDVNSPFWRNSNFKWNPKWAKMVSPQIPLVLEAWSLKSLSTPKEITRAQYLLRNLEGTIPGTWVKWQLALAYGLQDRTDLAVDYLQALIDEDEKAIKDDQIMMAAARMLYQNNKLDAAMKYYDQVPKDSDYWIEAAEEKGWIYARLNNFDRTLGQMKTVLSPSLSAQVGPEPYFLAALSYLRVCDYNSIFTVLKDFKSNNQKKLTELDALSKTGHTPTADRAILKLSQGVSKWEDLGPSVAVLPRFINRDEWLMRDVNRKDFISASKRLQKMAQEDLAEMRKILTKLQIVETEAIHRMNVGQTFAKKVEGGNQKIATKDRIEFPFEEKEVWVDELDHYEAKTKGCPAPPSSKQGQKL